MSSPFAEHNSSEKLEVIDSQKDLTPGEFGMLHRCSEAGITAMETIRLLERAQAAYDSGELIANASRLEQARARTVFFLGGGESAKIFAEKWYDEPANSSKQSEFRTTGGTPRERALASLETNISTTVRIAAKAESNGNPHRSPAKELADKIRTIEDASNKWDAEHGKNAIPVAE